MNGCPQSAYVTYPEDGTLPALNHLESLKEFIIRPSTCHHPEDRSLLRTPPCPKLRSLSSLSLTVESRFFRDARKLAERRPELPRLLRRTLKPRL